MFNDKFKNIKALIKNNSEQNANKKKIENLVIFLVLLIITIIAINVILSDDGKSNQKENTQSSTYKQLANQEDNSSNISENSEYNLSEELEKVLAQISGVGQVEVLITYSETSETVPMYNEKITESTTQETDTNGGVRTIQQLDNSKEIIYEEQSGEKTPITKKIILPKIEGAIIIAQGAENTNVKVNIIQAVEAVTGLPTHKVQVFEMN